MIKFPALSNFSPVNLALAGAAVASVAAVVYVASRKARGDTRGAAEMLGEAVASAAGRAVVGAGVGAVKGIGESVGIPDTSLDKCAIAKRDGDTWNASLYCSAGDFLGWMRDRATGDAGITNDARVPAPYVDDTVRPILKRGSTGNAVRELQGKLGVVVDGSFGPNTETAVKSFQSRMRLKPDGIVGPQTWTALDVGYAVVNQDGVLTDSQYRDMVR